MHVASYSYVDCIASLVTSSLAWPDCLFTFSTTNNSDSLHGQLRLQSNTCYILPYRLFLHATDHTQKYKTRIISRHDAIHLQTTK